MISASPSPVSPSPIRRLARASAACSSSGKLETSTTLSIIRTAIGTNFASALHIEMGSLRERLFYQLGEVNRSQKARAVGAAVVVRRTGCGVDDFAISEVCSVD